MIKSNITISLCMIVKNGGETLDKCLSSVSSIVDEYIIVDTGSTDNTLEIIQKYNKPYFFSWCDDFSLARNYSFEQATGDYILWLDADDYISEEDIIKFKELKKTITGSIDSYQFWYNYRHDSNGNCIKRFRRDRLIRNDKKFRWYDAIHEGLECGEFSLTEDITVTHLSNHDNHLKYIEFFDKVKNNRELSTREKFYYGGELFVAGRINDCIEVLEDYFNSNPVNDFESKKACEYLGNSYIDKKEYKKALKYFYRYLELYMAKKEIYYKLAVCLTEERRYIEAIFYLEACITFKFPNDPAKEYEERYHLMRDIYLKLCVIYYNQNDIIMSIYYNDKVLEEYPNDEIGLYNKKYFNSIQKEGK